MSQNPSMAVFTLRRSCALLTAWRGTGSKIERPPEPVLERFLRLPGVYRPAPNLLAVTAIPGDPTPFEVALAAARELAAPRRWPGEGPATRTLVMPGVVDVEPNGSCRLRPDPMSRALGDETPVLAPGSYLTTRTYQTLEYPVEKLAGENWRTASGVTVPLIRAGGPLPDQPPWRNRDVLGERSAWVARPSLTVDELLAALDETLLLVEGPMGVGKTRLLAETLRRGGRSHFWLAARPARLRGPGLGQQILRQLLLPTASQQTDPLHPRLEGDLDVDQVRKALAADRHGERERRILAERAIASLRHLAAAAAAPLTLVVDDLHACQGHDLELLGSLAGLAEENREKLRLVLVGRGGDELPAPLREAYRFLCPPLGEAEMATLADRLTDGFALPTPFIERLLESVAGSPFALEECLFALVHEKNLRRVYGSFFFAGDPARGFTPSQRFARHVDAEVGRLAPPWPARLLALLETAAPAPELAAAVEEISPGTSPGWAQGLIQAGLIERAESPWGEGLQIASEALKSALRSFLPADRHEALGRLAGRQLAGSGSGSEALWKAYRLISGDPEATTPLLNLFAGGDLGKVPQAELLEALAEEIEALRQRGGDDALELELLWRLLPLARKLGTLRTYQPELARAVELGTSDPPRLLALASIKAEMDQEAGRHQEAETTIRRALEAAADADPQRKALLLIQLGRLLMRQRRQGEARQLFTSVREAVGVSGTNPMAATCDFYLGNLALSDGRLDEAEAHHQAALEFRRQQNLKRPAGSSLSALGAVEIARGDYPRALAYYREAEEILDAHGKAGEKSFALLGQARALSRLGDFTGATRPVRQALELREGRDDAVGEALARLAVARNYLDIGQPGAALEQARKAHFQLNLISAEEHLAETESLLGLIHLSQRRLEAAKRRFETARRAHTEAGNLKAAALDLAGLLEIALAEEDTRAVRRRTTDLKNLLPDLPRSDVSDTLTYRLFLGLDYLTGTGLKVGNPHSYLERAYQGVLEKAEHLSHEQRQRYLFQIPDNQEILAAATERGLAAK